MNLNRRHFMGASMAAMLGLVTSDVFAAPSEATLPLDLAEPLPAVPALAEQPDIIRQALDALGRHGARITMHDRIGVADYSLGSGQARFHLVDVETGRVERSYLVSHGRGSDPANSGYVQRFSNRPGSNASSRGSFVTGDSYVGKHGRSRRLHGLDPDNSLAFERAIVIHGADYVDRAMAESEGRVGRSLGCFAFERSRIDEVMALLGPGRLLYSAS